MGDCRGVTGSTTVIMRPDNEKCLSRHFFYNNLERRWCYALTYITLYVTDAGKASFFIPILRRNEDGG
nr:MAG TPA: hypothetical protein [Caudoviricetes sp.]